MFNFCKNKKWFFMISCAIMLIGVVALFINGVQLDIQFSGGSKVSYSYTGDLNLGDIEKIATDVIGTKATAQSQTAVSDDKDVKTVVISFGGTSSISPDKLQKLTDEIVKANSDNNIEFYETQSVEPYIGARFFRKGIMAMAIAAVFIVIYVTIRFKKISGLSASVTALAALLHDIILVFFTFVIFKIPINDGFVAVILTVLGYSINDTMVIYDKIRYNSRLHAGKMSYEEIANLSINECITRTINTSLMSTIAIALVYVFSLVSGLTSVANFALPMMVGIISGCYSTLTITAPLWVTWQNHKAKKVK